MPENSIVVTSPNGEDLTELLDLIEEHSARDHINFENVTAKIKDSSFLSSGIPQIIEIVIAMGSSGAIAALTTILTVYFTRRPRARIKIRHSTADGAQFELSAENLNPDTLKNILASDQK